MHKSYQSCWRAARGRITCWPCTPSELALARLPSVLPVGALIFSAKESVYKAWSPLTGAPLDHGDAAVAFASDGTFTVELVTGAARARAGADGITFAGRYAVTAWHVFTAVLVPPA